jgi:hypothetical protein
MNSHLCPLKIHNPSGETTLLSFFISLFFFIKIDYAYTTFTTIVNMLVFLKCKNKYIFIRKFNTTSNEKNLFSPNFYTI